MSNPQRDGRRGSPVCVVSTTSALAVGGISTYVRWLTGRLADERPTSAVARFTRHDSRALDPGAAEPRRTLNQSTGVPLRIVAPPRILRPLAAASGRLIHTPRLQPAAVAAFVAAFGAPVLRAIPRDVGVVHWAGSGWELLGFAALFVARSRGAAFTVLPAIHPGSWGDGPLDGRLYAAADHVVAASRFEARVLTELGVSPTRITVTGLGPGVRADGDGRRFRARLGLGDRPIVLFLGRKQRYKGYHVLREAVARIRRDVPSVALVAIGGSEEFPRVQLPADVALDLGEAPEIDVADALAACDVLCVPSSGESFGIVYVEAWQYGKPVIVGPAPASRELVEDGVTGLHVEQRADDIARGLLRLLRDPATARRLGAAGRRLQRERYSWPAVWAIHEGVFARAGHRAPLIGPRGARRGPARRPRAGGRPGWPPRTSR
jgi:glycosyltransferase involved in cell wall biosynthesis